MKNNNRAFTLIELLVVIAIIAILAAILFPVFAQAKLSAKKAVMVSNEKQIVLGMIMYTNDSDDLFPQGETGDDFNPQHPHITWSTMIYPYVKNGDQLVDPVAGNTVSTAKGGLFYDPAAPQIDLKNVHDEGYYEGPNDLICPANYQGGETWFDNNGQLVTPLATTALATPADTVLLSEKGLNQPGPWNFPWLYDEQSKYIGSIANVPGNPGAGVKTDGNTSMNPSSDVYSPVIDTDCTSATESNNYDCAALPRYRYAGQTVMSYGDGHVKTVARGGLKWFKNIYIQRPDITSSNWVYGFYYPAEPF